MKNLKKIMSMFFVLLFMVMLIPNNLNEVQAAAPKLNMTSLTLMKDNTYTLKLQNNKSKVKWTTSNKKVATVTSKGKVTAKKVGTTTITAKVGNEYYGCTVTVKKFGLNYESLELSKDQSNTLQLGNLSGTKVKWFSFNNDVVSVDKKGKITANKGGSSKIIGYYNGKFYSCNVNVVTDMPVLFSNNNLTVYFYKFEAGNDSYTNRNSIVYLRIQNKMSKSIYFTNQSISINNQSGDFGYEYETIPGNSTKTVRIDENFDESFLNINNLLIKNISGSFEYSLFDSKYDEIEIDYNVNIQ